MAEHWCKAAVESVITNPAAAVAAPPTSVGQPQHPTAAQLALQQQQAQYQQYYNQYSSYYASTVAQQTQASTQPTVLPQVNYAAAGSGGAAYGRPPQHQYAPPQTYQQAPHAYAYQPPAQQQAYRPAPAPAPAPAARPAQTVLPTQTYKQALAGPAAAPPAAPAGPGQWPPNLKRFVERAFSLCQSDADRLFVSNKLRAQLSKVSAEGTMFTHNWDAEPTPDPRKKEEPPAIASAAVGIAVPADEKPKKKSRFALAENKPKPVTTAASTATSYYGPQTGPAPAPSPAAKAKAGAGIGTVKVDHSTLLKRQNRFGAGEDGPQRKKSKKQSAEISYAALYSDDTNQTAEFDVSKLTVVGTCRKVEKEYFRLTSAPDPSTVRPEPVLREALAAVKAKWEARSAEYVYLCSQLKSIRQDLTVQHIITELTVDVYETHARIALQCQDLNEYNQCQTQLKHFYADHANFNKGEMEFVAYRILYYVYLLGNQKYQRGSSDLLNTMASLDQAAFSHPAVIHALKVRRAVQSDNYVKFFQLYKETPNLGNYLLDLMLYPWRLQAAIKIVKSFKPSIEVAYVARVLGFTTENECEEFLKECGCQFTRTPRADGNGDVLALDSKNSASISSNTVVKQDKLLL